MTSLYFISWAVILTLFSPGSPAEVLSGQWWIRGNETFGDLVLRVDRNGNVRGTVYDQPLEGTFDATSGELRFTRFRDRADDKGIQIWSGKLTYVADSQPPAYRLEGVFRSIAGETFGMEGVEYPWRGVEVRHRKPAVDLLTLQGCWRVSRITKCALEQVQFPLETGLNELDAEIELRRNELIYRGEVVATIANELPLKSIESEIGFRAYRLLCLTLPDGRGLICSYIINDEGVEIAYPHTTSCHRGSGNVVFLKRQ